MLYVVLMPVKKDNVRRLVLMYAMNFGVVRKVLGLPVGWLSWVSFAETEVNDMSQRKRKYITKVILKG